MHTKKRVLQGTVVSDKMQKTVVVRVDRVKIHPIYKKRYMVSKRYKAHDEQKVSKVGIKVMIEECSPMSKDTKWRIVTPIS